MKHNILKIQTILTIATLTLVQAAFSSDLKKGQVIYQKNCLMCHGLNGKNTMANAANFKRGQGLFNSDFFLLQRIQKGNKACPAYRGILKEQQIFDVIAYIRTLHR
ncbi:MAG: c-type cytochrome [Gammaproteobacteria bacterium]|jgi:cytochrome c6|nr:c-type cytochrome [Gammaproteobacteria bacterium]MBT3725722.1 c-type cytochrome [Gammaproteobacteria bacterium]MBT4075764.1 c-type cytochrome [Gammaproteobacteria bacterium]MBT4195478.1 c-type cytochrome [Gammaproteobacteria bacterium]MBT4449415.1 c-type cytochrome [Gammaproteobacteria bacterium]